MTIPGIKVQVATTLIAETGVNMEMFLTHPPLLVGQVLSSEMKKVQEKSNLERLLMEINI